MSILKIARMGHPVLRAMARRVDRREIKTSVMQTLVDDMIATMDEYQGIGLAAPQIHHGLRLFIAIVKSDDLAPDAATAMALFNPELTVVGSDVVEDWEGCLSIPRVRGLVPRARSIAVTALDREGHRLEFLARDLSARVIQHEYDHIDGVLFMDRMRNLKSLAYVDPSPDSDPAF